MPKKDRSKKRNSPPPPATSALTARDVTADLAASMSERGFWPALMAFQDAEGRIEVYTKGGIDVSEFLNHLVEDWLPRAMSRTGAEKRRTVQ